MKMNFLRKAFVVFSSTLLLSYGVYSYGCADGWWGDGYNSMFAPETFVDDSYKPLFLDSEHRFYDYGYLDNYLKKNNDDIVADWTGYIGKAEPKAAVAYYLLNDTASQYIAAIINDRPTKGAKYTLNNKNAKTKDFLEFLQIAKKIEQYSTNSYYYWDYDNRKISYTDAKVISTIEDYYNRLENRDAFYKNRIWFQLMKAKFYSNNVNDAITFFDATKANQPKNDLYYRALGYVAGAYYQKGNFDKSNVLFAEIFNQVPKLRQESLYNFKPMDEASFKKQLDAAQTKEVKAALWAIYGYYKDEFQAMQEIYKLDSKSEHINFLLTRWVNLQENAINVYREKDITTPGNYHKEVAKAINQKQFKWVNDVAANPDKVQNPELWLLASGYLNIFQGNHKDAEKAFAQATKLNKSTDVLVKNQIRLMNLINNVSQVKEINTTVEGKLITDLNWLLYELPETVKYDNPLRYDYATEWVKDYLSAVYKTQNNLVMAEVLNTNKSFYDKEANGIAMEKFFLNKNKTAWEELFVGLYPYNLSDIYQCRAINLYYNNKLDDAIAMYEKIIPVPMRSYDYDTSKYTTNMVDYKTYELFGNPFNGKIRDCNDCDHQAKQSVKYTALSMMKKMKEMKANVDSGNDVYNNALLLANAYYNTSYYGNARSFYYNSIFNEYGSNYISKENQRKLFDMSQAKKYYEIALKAATDNEQRAKIAYMLAKVERNDFYYNEYFKTNTYWGYSYDQVMVKKWDGFKQLKDHYSDTKYYQEVIKECGYFRTYLGLQR